MTTTSNHKPRTTNAVLLASLVLVVFLPALWAGWIWDDDRYVTTNHALRSLRGLLSIWSDVHTEPQYYPLTHSVLWLQYHLWGLHPLGYHVVNLALQAANAVLLWWLLEALAVPGAWFAAALFAVHPVQVETVAWITEQKNLLSVFFALLCALAWRKERYGAMLALFAAALLSKSVVAVLPAAFLVLAWWKKGKLGREDVQPVLPMFAMALAMGALTVWIERHVGASGAEYALSAADRVLIAGRALLFYAGKVLLPFELTFIYPRWDVDAASLAQWVYPFTATALLVLLFLARRRFGRGPAAMAFLFAGILFPALGFFNVYPMRYSFVADHFQYLACAALFAGAASLIKEAAPRALVLGALGLLSFFRAFAFHDSLSLWNDTIAKNPDSWMVRYNVGASLAGLGRWNEAEPWFRSALALRPGDAGVHNNLGTLLLNAGKPAQAIEEYRLALRLDPASYEAHNNLGAALVGMGKTRDAVEEYEQALKLKPDLARGWFNLGEALGELGRYKEGADCLARALEIQPDYPDARADLAELRRRAKP